MSSNIYAFVGLIMLIGIVKKNAIMMIDFALEAQRERRQDAGRSDLSRPRSMRFRPIMMTTMAALMGTLPIALGWGAGAESRQPLGLAVVGGLARLAGTDALHHAGGLYLSREVPGAVQYRFPERLRRLTGRRPSTSREPRNAAGTQGP